MHGSNPRLVVCKSRSVDSQWSFSHTWLFKVTRAYIVIILALFVLPFELRVVPVMYINTSIDYISLPYWTFLLRYDHLEWRDTFRVHLRSYTCFCLVIYTRCIEWCIDMTHLHSSRYECTIDWRYFIRCNIFIWPARPTHVLWDVAKFNVGNNLMTSVTSHFLLLGSQRIISYIGNVLHTNLLEINILIYLRIEFLHFHNICNVQCKRIISLLGNCSHFGLFPPNKSIDRFIHHCLWLVIHSRNPPLTCAICRCLSSVGAHCRCRTCDGDKIHEYEWMRRRRIF